LRFGSLPRLKPAAVMRKASGPGDGKREPAIGIEDAAERMLVRPMAEA